MDVRFPDIEVNLSKCDGNVFFIIGRVSAAIRRAGHREAADEFAEKARSCESYDKVLRLCMKTVEVS